MLFFFFAFDILNILYFYCFFYSFHNFVAFDRFVDLLCCYAQLDFTCSRVRPLKHCIIFSLVYSYFFFFVFVLFPSSIFFLGKRLGYFCFVLFFYHDFLFRLLVITCWLSSLFFYVIHRLFALFPSSIFFLGKKTRLVFCCDFLFHLLVVTCWLSSSFSMLYIGCELFSSFSFCCFSLQFFLADFLADFLAVFVRYGFLHFHFFYVLYTCNVFMDTV